MLVRVRQFSVFRQGNRRSEFEKCSDEALTLETSAFQNSLRQLKELRHDILSRFLRRAKMTFNVKETTKYSFGKTEKHQIEKNKPKRNKDG